MPKANRQIVQSAYTPLNNYSTLVRPYAFLGVENLHENGNGEAIGDCPFCGKEQKYSINIAKGQWRCFVCGEGSTKGGGNYITFIKMLWDISDKQTKDYELLSKQIKLLYPESLMQWGICQSTITGEWLIPAFDQNKNLVNLYKYVKWSTDIKPTAKCIGDNASGLFGMNLYDDKKQDLYLCESWKDAVALWEVLKMTKRVIENGITEFQFTASPESSLLNDSNVVAIPGANNWKDSWSKICIGKRVFLMCHNDQREREVNGTKKLFHPGYDGMKRIAERLSLSGDGLPTELCYLKWSDSEQIFNSTLPNGYDLRDYLTEGIARIDSRLRIQQLKKLLEKVVIIPSDWIKGRSPESMKSGSCKVDPEKCDSWKVLETAWRKCFTLTEGLRGAIISACAVGLSTESGYDDQLWMLIISPPSGGKSTICDGLDVSDHVYQSSEFTSFHSGWLGHAPRGKKKDKDGHTKTTEVFEDFSILAKTKNKMFITKDGDTLWKSANRERILSQARDIYDRKSSSCYANGVSHTYDNHNMTWCIFGTPQMEEMDKSELGARQLTYVIADHVDAELNRGMTIRKITSQVANNIIEDDGEDGELIIDPDALQHARRLLGGYIDWLWSNCHRIRADNKIPKRYINVLAEYADFISYFRARPNDEQDEVKGDREYSTRLGSQIISYAMCVCGVLQKEKMDEEVIRLARKVTLDTARGKTMDLAQIMYKYQESGITSKGLSSYINKDHKEVLTLLVFMEKIKVCRYEQEDLGMNGAIKGNLVWKLTDTLYELYGKVVHG